MAIKIIKDQAGTTAKVEGIDVKSIPLNSYTCGVSVASGGITIFNPDAPNEQGNPTKIFNNVHFTNFVKADGSVPVSADDLKADIDSQLVQAAPTDVSAGYEGLWDASTNTPDLTGDFNLGDWFYVGTEGTHNGVDYKVNDIIKYNGTDFDLIPNPNLRVDDIENSSINAYDIVVDADYLGSIKTGSALQPYTDLATAIANSNSGDNILVKGVNVIASEIVLPHSLSLYGSNEAEIKFATYNASNGDIFSFTGDMSQEFRFENIDFSNAGGYGLYINKTLKTVITECKFKNNGWNGTGLNTVLSSTTSGVLGYDSSSADLQSFYAGANASNGGAIRIQEATQVEIINNNVSNNLRGIRLQDCGIGGYGYVTRNQVSQNIDSGIYLASNSYNSNGGCENFTVYNNASKYNSNNGVLVIGGINNVVSLNIVEGNWNAGVMGWHVSNTRFRDLDLTNNNRSQYNGIGNAGDAHSSITIGGDTARAERGYIASILSCEVYNTGLGSNTSRIGFQILQDVEDVLEKKKKNLINIDDSGFHNQDYSIDVLADLDNVKLTIGDCRYVDTVETNITIASGSYYEQPFSNHITNLKECDFSVEGESVILKEGVNGVRLNPYTLHDLQANLSGSNINIMLKGSEKIQFNLDVSGVSIDGILLSGTNQEKVNELNALLQHSGSSAGQAPVITSSLAVSMEQGSTLNYELTADYGVAYEWDLSNVPGIATVEGSIRNIIGGSSLLAGTYNIPVSSINYNGVDSETLVLTVNTPSFSSDKSVKFDNLDYLSANATLVDSSLGRGSSSQGSSDAWTISMWVKPVGTQNNQTFFYFGGNDNNNEGHIWLRYYGSSSFESIMLEFGTSNNNLKMLTSSQTIPRNQWTHFVVTYDGGTTGSSSGNLSTYYGRFNFYANGVLISTSNTHQNFGYSGSIKDELFQIGKKGASTSYVRDGGKIDEVAIWNSDQSSNVSSIYNNGTPSDLSGLTSSPSHWWRMGDGDSYPNIDDNIGNADFTMNNQTAADIVSDTP